MYRGAIEREDKDYLVYDNICFKYHYIITCLSETGWGTWNGTEARLGARGRGGDRRADHSLAAVERTVGQLPQSTVTAASGLAPALVTNSAIARSIV